MNFSEWMQDCIVMRKRDIILNLAWIILFSFCLGAIIGSEKAIKGNYEYPETNGRAKK